MTLQTGDMLDHYRLVAPIGAGGMGVVWKARDTSLDRDVAIKVLPAEFTADGERRARFEREARAVAALSHPNVVSIYGFGTAGGTTYAAIELLEGATLREQLEEGPLPVRKAIEIARQVAAGLDAAHARGIVHRDLKPENVVVTPDGRARVLDFGLAGFDPGHGDGSDSDLPTRGGLTGPGAVMGTVGYMSPEQVRGASVDSRGDIFALGALLQEMLSGERPFQRDTAAETMTAILREDPPELTVGGRPAPPALARVVGRCLEKAPDERFQSARDLAFALENATSTSGSGATPVPVGSAPGRARAWRTPALALAAAAVFAAGWLARPLPSAPAPPRVSQLTFSGSDSDPTVSPDHRLIAFASARTGASRIWLRQVGGAEQPLTEGADALPRFSPDGGSIAFVRREGRRSSAYRVPVVGGQPRKLIDDVLEVAWSPDGERLAFLRGSASGADLAGTALGVADVAGGEQAILAQFEGWDLVGLAWSPDGARIATTRASTQGGAGDWKVLLVDPAGGEIEEIVPDGGGLVSTPTWLSDGALLYARSPTTVTTSPAPVPIVRRDLATGEERTLVWAAHLFPFRALKAGASRTSRLGADGIVFDTYLSAQRVVEYDLQTGGRTEPEGFGVSADRQPAYSPDGERLIFTSNRTGNVDLFSYERRTGRLFQLTEHPGSDWDGAYTPDGESILWSSDRSGNLEIWIANADGSNPRQVTRDGVAAENPTMTPDGEWIVYSSGRPTDTGLYRIRPDGSDETLIVAGNWVNPEVSPDGRYAGFVTTDAGRLVNQLRFVEIATGAPVDFEVSFEYSAQAPNVTYGRIRWMPGGRAIAYVGLDGAERVGVWVQDFEPGRDTSATRRPLLEFRRDAAVESFGISPDGSRAAVSTFQEIRSLSLAQGLDLDG